MSSKVDDEADNTRMNMISNQRVTTCINDVRRAKHGHNLSLKIKRERYLAKQALADTDTIMQWADIIESSVFLARLFSEKTRAIVIASSTSDVRPCLSDAAHTARNYKDPENTPCTTLRTVHIEEPG
ncbi:hypothetical protein DPMN_162026 [Dreissena polymorpha]|uniref:Uncharacterized protein n=1 Tax=Dreissena polymorpha TaxID=45954 RepID=A0A9D4EPV2_DREPO|nr:hypothetical protein DPMN_162026 [Dreissena polymorpha]